MKAIQFAALIVTFFSGPIAAEEVYSYPWSGSNYFAKSTSGISSGIITSGNSVTFHLLTDRCVRGNASDTYQDDCDRGIFRSQLQRESELSMNRDLRYNFSIKDDGVQGLGLRSLGMNIFEIKPYGNASPTVPTFVLYFQPKTRKLLANIVMTNNVGGANVHLPNTEINTVIGSMKSNWNDFQIETKQSTRKDGYIKIRQNGVLIYEYHGQTSYAHQFGLQYWFGPYICCGNTPTGEPNHTLVYRSINGSVVNSNDEPVTNFSTYVNKYGDLLAAYNANSGGQSKSAWGKRHYCDYGQGEGRTSSGLTSSVCATTLDTTSSTIKVSVNDILERGNRFSDEITQGVGEFSRIAVFNGGIFSFKDYETFRAIKVRENQGLMLGFSKHRDKDGVLHDPVGIGWLFDDVALMVAQDNSMFGYRAEGVFDFKDPSTTYIGAGFRKKLAGKAMLYTDLMYAFGRSRPGELTMLSHLHALGLETRLDIRANWRNRFRFRFDLPLRIEHGSSRFYVEQGGRVHPLVIDLEPAVRQSSLSFNHSYRWSRKLRLISEINYTHNPNHRRGRNDYRAHLRVQYRF
mgnify:CR=1 FL=1|tara:strand:- start:477 stop:2195 length:1719 start_codon:yes stop_codon:yes gene_type:complete